jgi:hypothetical protein
VQPELPAMRKWSWLLLIPFVALLWVPFFARVQPAISGVPFFIWYQMVWCFLVGGLVYLVFLLERGQRRGEGGDE